MFLLHNPTAMPQPIFITLSFYITQCRFHTLSYAHSCTQPLLPCRHRLRPQKHWCGRTIKVMIQYLKPSGRGEMVRVWSGWFEIQVEGLLYRTEVMEFKQWWDLIYFKWHLIKESLFSSAIIKYPHSWSMSYPCIDSTSVVFCCCCTAEKAKCEDWFYVFI